jgi:putative membrane protein
MANPQDILSAERTLLAWIRTGIAMMGLGFVVARFGLFLHEFRPPADDSLSPSEDSAPIGMAVVASGIAINIWASVRHHRLVRRLRAGEQQVSSIGPVVVGVATGLGGALLIALLEGTLK